MSTHPTDAEIDALWRFEASKNWDSTLAMRTNFTRAVLAKWGQPAQAAEPFCWHWENTFNGGTGAVKKNPETLGINMAHPDYKWTALYTTPQPVAREPLTDEQIDAAMPPPSQFGIVQPPWCGSDVTILRAMARAIEAAHGIKGGQHGTDSHP